MYVSLSFPGGAIGGELLCVIPDLFEVICKGAVIVSLMKCSLVNFHIVEADCTTMQHVCVCVEFRIC